MRTKVLIGSCLLSLVFVASCNGQAQDALSSLVSGSPPSRPAITGTPSISLPSAGIPSPSIEGPSIQPSRTAEPTEEPTTAEPTTAEPTTAEPSPTPVPTEQPTPSEAVSPTSAPSGEASTGTSAVWWVLGILAVAAIVALVILRSRRRPSATVQQAYRATAAVRDRLAREVSAPSAVPGELEALVEEADRALRTVGVSPSDESTRVAVEQTIRALGETREGLALREATAGAAHASEADVETMLLRALAALDAALGPLREAMGGSPPTGFEA